MYHYHRAVTYFSPEGYLLQVEFAQEAVRKGSTAVAIRGRNCIVMAVEKKPGNALQLPRTSTKIWVIDDHVMLTFAGLTADARILIKRLQVECQSYRLNIEDAVTIQYIARYLANYKQKYTHCNGVRPFGVSCLIGGFNIDGTPQLYQTEPSGMYYEWKAYAIGRSANTVRQFLESHYYADAVRTKDDTVKLAMRALMQVCPSTSRDIELTVLQRNLNFDVFSRQSITEYCEVIEEEAAQKDKRKRLRYKNQRRY